MPAKSSRRFSCLPAAICAGCLLLLAATPVLARPSAMKLFPEETLLLVRTPSAGDLFDRLRETATGRMVRDPQLAPLVERLYGSAGDLYTEKVAEWLGVSWEELQDLPRAEVAFAIVARRDYTPAFVLLVDQGDAPSVAKRLLDSGLERLKEDGGETTTETIEGVEVTVVREGDNQDHTVGIFEKENTIVAATDPGLIREILEHWHASDGELALASGGAAETETTASTEAESTADEPDDDEPRQYTGRTLAENNKFVTILRHCRRAHDPPPNIIFYVDPIGLIRQSNRDNAGMAVAMATFPALGIDGLSGIGATMTFATGRYDGLSHLHVLLDNPRAGVMQVIAFEPGDTTPEPWVFADLETYFTWNWNVRTSFNTIRSLIDRFQYAGATDKFVAEHLSEAWGINFETNVIDNFAGRFSWMIGYEKPARFRGQQSTLAFKVADQAAAETTLATILAKFPERTEERKFGDVTYHAFVIEWPEELRDDPPSTPFVAVMDGYLFLGGSCQLFEQAIAARDGTVERLADVPAYQQMLTEVEQEAPGVTPAVWMYSRPEESLRQWYDLLTSEKTKEYLAEHAEGNPFFAALSESLAANELPPFDVIARYMTPSVGVIYDTDTGFHGISFTLRDEVEPTP
jgi:hypothetical protein